MTEQVPRIDAFGVRRCWGICPSYRSGRYGHKCGFSCRPRDVCMPWAKDAAQDQALLSAVEDNHWDIAWDVLGTGAAVVDNEFLICGDPIGRGETAREAIQKAIEKGGGRG